MKPTVFLCKSRRLVVEVDGPIHDDPTQKERDHNRDIALRDLGYSIVRLQNQQVLGSPEEALRLLERRALE